MNIQRCSFEYHMYFTHYFFYYFRPLPLTQAGGWNQSMLLGAMSIQLYLPISIPASYALC